MFHHNSSNSFYPCYHKLIANHCEIGNRSHHPQMFQRMVYLSSYHRKYPQHTLGHVYQDQCQCIPSYWQSTHYYHYSKIPQHCLSPDCLLSKQYFHCYCLFSQNCYSTFWYRLSYHRHIQIDCWSSKAH